MKSLFIQTLFVLKNKERKRMALLVLLDLFINALDILFLGLTVLMINFYAGGNTVHNKFFSHLLPNKNSLPIVSIFLLLFSLKNFGGYLVSKAQSFLFYHVASRLAEQNIIQYLKGDHINYVNTDSSVYIRKISQQPIEFSSYILTNVQQVISQGLLILFTVIAILFYHPTQFLLLFLLLLPPVILLGLFIKSKLQQLRVNIKTVSQLAIQHLKEAISGYVESNIYAKDVFFSNRFLDYQVQLTQNIALQQTIQALPSRLMEVFAIIGFFILIVLNRLMVNPPGIDLLNIGIFMTACYKIIPGIVKILNAIGQIKTYSFTIHDLLPNPAPAVAKKVNDMPCSINSISFNQVTFKYRQQSVLTHLNFKLCAGDFAGIYGKSGLGKTTIVNLLLGFLEPENGCISINNEISAANERKQYWPQIAYVKQQPFFINDTVLKNITLSDETYNADKLNDALSMCGIDILLEQYPEGVHKLITENGKNMSGGQRQRIALARALYRDFDLLILDEPFSEMDEQAEKTILMNLALLTKKSKIILMITHHTASLSFCNKIISANGER